MDGAIDVGRSNVDQKTITGESVPILREPGDPVYAGTLNGDGTLEVTATGPVEEALISRVVAQVRASQAGRASDRAPDLAFRRRLHSAGCGTVGVHHAGAPHFHLSLSWTGYRKLGTLA